MRGRMTILGLLTGAALIAASVTGIRLAARSAPSDVARENPAGRPVRLAAPIDALDYSIQERFRDLTGFGMARIPVVPQHVYEFAPETADEKAAVEGLRDRGWSVGFYLGGRGLLDPPMSESEWKKEGPNSLRRAISKPIVIAGLKTPADLPNPWELQAIGRSALEAFATRDRYESSFGRWTVDARAIRASQATCLECHTGPRANDFTKRAPNPEATLKVGDPLGAAIYVYARVQR